MNIKIDLNYTVNLEGMLVGDVFFFCNFCGYQHKTGFIISGRECPECRRGPMIHCTVTPEDLK